MIKFIYITLFFICFSNVTLKHEDEINCSQLQLSEDHQLLSFNFMYYGGNMKTVIGFVNKNEEAVINTKINDIKYGLFFTGNSVSSVINGDIDVLQTYQNADKFQIIIIENKVFFCRNGRVMKQISHAPIQDNFSFSYFDLVKKTGNYQYHNIKHNEL